MSKFLGLAVATAATVLSAQAFAATTTQTFFTGTAPFTSGPATPQSPAFNNTIQVASFNTSTGATLNSVTITINGSATIEASVFGSGAAPFSNVVANTTVSGSTGGNTFFSQNLTSGSFSGTVGAGQVVSGAGLTTSFSDSDTLTGAAIAPFAGNGTTPVALNFAASALAASGTGVNFVTFFGGDASVLATLTVTYDFTAAPPVGVPEPASLALLGLGLAAVGVIRRRV